MRLFRLSCILLASVVLVFLVCPSHSSAEIVDKATLEFSPEEKSVLGLLGGLIGLSVDEISSIISLTKLGLGLVDALETIFVKVFNGTSFDVFGNPEADKQLLGIFEVITYRLDQIQRGTEGTEGSLRSIARDLPYLVRWEIALDTIEEYTRPVNNLFHKFSYYQKFKLDVEDHTLFDFAENAVSHSTTSVQALMASIHSMVAPLDPPKFELMKLYERDEYDVDNRVSAELSRTYRRLVTTHPGNAKYSTRTSSRAQELTLRPSIFEMLEDAILKYGSCNYRQTPQQLIFGLYTLLSLTLARGYAMINFSYNILRFHNEGNFTVERRLTDELYKHYTKGLYMNAFNTMKRASSSYRRCDPKEHKENSTYVMVTELLQGYIENEVDLNKRKTCGTKCSDYQHTDVHGCYLPKTQYCGKHRRCQGKVHHCRFFDADAHVCISSVPYRRYDWVRYEDKQALGPSGSTCDNVMKVDSWWRFLYHCSYCVCLCDDPKSNTTDRYISLKPSVSDIAEGKIVTGIRFTKVDRVLHMQVQEGKATSQGQVDPETVKWVNVNPVSVEGSKEDVDYVTLKYEKRSIDLDHLRAPKRHVVTGVRFQMLGEHVNMEMWVTPINFTTGKMSAELSYWISNDNTPIMAHNPRKELHLLDPDDPTKMKSESVVDSTSDMFISLQPTSLRADVSQLTVPFFDAQSVAPYPSTWLEGLQFYHRGRAGYGGFLGFRVLNFNMTRHFGETLDLDVSELNSSRSRIPK